MKTFPSIIRIALGLLALLFAVTIAQAKEDNDKEKKISKEALKKYDANKDGMLDDTEKAAMKADAGAKAKEMKAADLAKYDVNKDGKLDDGEKAAMKADKEAAKETKKTEREAKKSRHENEQK